MNRDSCSPSGKADNGSPREMPPLSFNACKNDRWIFECIFPGKRDGFFVELGAANGRGGSSCFLLEKKFGWNGICVEPNRDQFRELISNRPGSVCENVCITSKTGKVTYIEGNGEQLHPHLGGVRENLLAHKDGGHEVVEKGIEVIMKALSMEDLLQKNGAPETIDYLSIDTEGSELPILLHFPFEKYRFLALSLECDGMIWDDITELLQSKGYVEVQNPLNPEMVWERYWIHQSIA